mmetsp:Transcript_5442/g.16226  ORF Transcript_5442/g.16226 Transcript_5442/m.16226 type:complete len:478 (+) Transcript_5442:272-1705(+)
MRGCAVVRGGLEEARSRLPGVDGRSGSDDGARAFLKQGVTDALPVSQALRERRAVDLEESNLSFVTTLGMNGPAAVRRRLRAFSPRHLAYMERRLPASMVHEDGSASVNVDLDGDILEREGSPSSRTTRTLLLNRPKTLNALTAPMCKTIYERLKRFETNSAVSTVIIRTTQSRAFCAGGDVKDVALAAHAGDFEKADNFFRQEYRMNYLLGSLRTTRLISFIEGITMGGGAGVSTHGKYVVASENTVFAMPECVIGFVPDVGTTSYLGKLPYSFGNYLALTGARLKGAAVVSAGIATHYVPSGRLDDLEESLSEADARRDSPASERSILQVLSEFAEPVVQIEEHPHVSTIRRCFSQETVENIVKELKSVIAEGGGDKSFAEEALASLMAGSPVSLKLALESVKRGKSMNLKRCLEMEFCMALNLIRESDFYEGIRAALIDKTKDPKWSASSTEEVKNISRFFHLPKGARGLFESD